ncbi:hypothetical protein AB0K00_25375 [Dactylosporangium sp. NPDC049525]|uniref:hypothetical protein n=1 Tax=Dactylosporangium sp. NPDC049525 TaxID=3154730 RepID=UPI0034271A6B
MEQALAVVLGVLGAVAVAAVGFAATAGRRRRFGIVRVPVDRWAFSGVLPVVLAVGVAVTAAFQLPWQGPGASVGRFAAWVVVCGVAAMVLIETVKRLLPLRGAYNRRQVAVWLDDRSRSPRPAVFGQLVRAMELVSAKGERPANDDGSRDLADAVVGERWRQVTFAGPGVGGAFNLPAEHLSAQIGAAVERASRHGTQYAELLLALCPDVDREDLHMLDDRRFGGDSGSSAVAAELSYGIATAIDQLQIRLAGRWRHYLQVTAWWLTGLIALLVALADGSAPLHSAAFVVAALLFGGFFAWLARDLSAAIERLRR